MNIRTATITAPPPNYASAKRGAAVQFAGAIVPAADAADLRARIEKVAAVAAAHAAAVDTSSVSRSEAIAAARAERLFGIAVPRELGGEGLASPTWLTSATRSAAPARRPP